MSTPTQIAVVVNPAGEGHALSLIGEELIKA